jgi:teichuronic acid biosynthesis glycosyltransferase TuaC
MRLMRIALVTTSWPADDGDPSGHFVQAEARALERQGHAVEVVAPAAGGAFGWPGVAARVRERPWLAFDAARWVLEARRRVTHLDVDRIVAHWTVPCAWPVAAGSRAQLHVVSHGGDVRVLLGLPAPLRERLVRDIAMRAAEWRFVSEALKASLVASVTPATRDRLEAIATVRPATIDLPDVAVAIARRRRELAGARVAVSVGRLVPGKRVDRAIEHVARARDVDALVVVGDGPERGRLEALARNHGVDARFVGLLPRTDALAWIGAAEHVLFASEAEGASTVLRECEALGTKVVVVGAE